MHVSVEPGAGIPAGRIRKILQPHRQGVRPRMDSIRNIYIKGVIAVWPEADLAAVYPDVSLAHRTVEQQHRPLAGRDLETAPVPSAAHIGQASGTAGLECGLFLIILGDRHVLEVIFPAERAVDGPVVRDAHILPGGVVIVGGGCLRGISSVELPALIQQYLAPLGEGRKR